MQRLTRGQAGFSMIEVMVTMFLVMIGLLVVMSAMVATAKSTRYAEEVDVANALMRMEMERLQNTDWDVIAHEEVGYGAIADHPDYRYSTAVTQNGRIKRIELTIWFENDRRSVTATTSIVDM
jgi:Tfp pilus assembly protein PilV